MERVAHRELRNNSSEVLRRVEAGESLSITNRGRIVAVLAPAEGDQLDRLIAAGQVRPARRQPDFTGIQRVQGHSSVEVLGDLRGDR